MLSLLRYSISDGILNTDLRSNQLSFGASGRQAIRGQTVAFLCFRNQVSTEVWGQETRRGVERQNQGWGTQKPGGLEQWVSPGMEMSHRLEAHQETSGRGWGGGKLVLV